MALTKYVSVTNGNDGSGDGSAGSPYFSIEKAKDEIDGTSDVGPHYIILSESSAARTIYSANTGMPANSRQDMWIGANIGLIVSGAHGQDIVIDGSGAAVSAFYIYGSGSGIHNLTIQNYGYQATANYGVIKADMRPSDIRGVTITEVSQSGITYFGDRYNLGGVTIIDRCRIEVPAASQQSGIAVNSNYDIGRVLVNNCLLVISGSSPVSSGATPSKYIKLIGTGQDSQSTASFNTVVIDVERSSYTDANTGIHADLAVNNIISMSMDYDNNRLNFIAADTATNNLYAGFNTTNVSTVGARRLSNGDSASFHATEIGYLRGAPLTLFTNPDPLIKSIFADWTLAADVSPAHNVGVALNSADYFGLVGVDLSGNLRSDPPDIGCFEFPVPVVPSPWKDYGSYSDPRYLNTGDILAGNVASSDYKLRAPQSPGVDQAPFVLNSYGILFRGRTKPYAVTTSRGGDPDDSFSGVIGEE